MTVFGNLVHAGELEQATTDTLKLWIGTYLRELERQYSLATNSLPPVRSWSIVGESQPDRFPEEGLPSVVVMSAGTTGTPAKEGRGPYRARWEVGVAVLVGARGQAATRRLGFLYGLAVRAIMVQKPSLGGFATATDWISESYDDIPTEERRSLVAAITTFNVEVHELVDVTQGPREVDPDPADWGTVQTADAEVHKVQI